MFVNIDNIGHLEMHFNHKCCVKPTASNCKQPFVSRFTQCTKSDGSQKCCQASFSTCSHFEQWFIYLRSQMLWWTISFLTWRLSFLSIEQLSKGAKAYVIQPRILNFWLFINYLTWFLNVFQPLPALRNVYIYCFLYPGITPMPYSPVN
jgi:hypothetical protein